ncbi:MAG: hypothetical protein ACR2FV_11940 [Ornithinimicrobium sp.]|jgi:hypothetical protein|uniref:hypothetical protein n=1 Tax=Ornithinimicrobium sp. TaxID=1977084 RepID=UPI003D9B5D55
MDPTARPPLDAGSLIDVLATEGVHWLLTGSVALQHLGGDITSHDLDIIPATDATALMKLRNVLIALDVVPTLCGTYDDLLPQSITMTVEGRNVRVRGPEPDLRPGVATVSSQGPPPSRGIRQGGRADAPDQL